MKKIIMAFMASLMFTSSAHAVYFSDNDTVGNIRQNSSTTVRFNLATTTITNDCSTKNFAVSIATTHPNFKNIYAAVLTAKAIGSTVQYAVFENQCIDGFAEIDTFTVKD